MSVPQQPMASHPHSHPPRITIKLKPDAHKLQQKDDQHLIKLFKKTDPGHGLTPHIHPLVTAQPADVIAKKVALAAQLDPTYKPVNFEEWYSIEFDPEEFKSIPDDGTDGHTRNAVVHHHARKLHEEDDVESAHIEGLKVPRPAVKWEDDPRSANQGYINPAPQGIDAKYAWSKFEVGGDGAGVNLVDIEYGWDLEHEDLADAKITLISGFNPDDRSHGTAVLGQILMVDNKIGGIGIAPSARGRVVSSLRRPPNNGYDFFNALIDATVHMTAGDVLLLEAQEYNPLWPTGQEPTWRALMPVEVADNNYAAIRLATGLGITVVEAGANGGNDLDAYKDSSGNAIFNRSDKGFRDSGAIIVGAAGSNKDKHERLWFSNYGSRIDVYAWGENVDTSYNSTDITDHRVYTGGFSGTSSASPIITGATLIVQGISNAVNKGKKLSPRQVREILTKGGTPSANPAADKIGVMPNLKAIIDQGLIQAAGKK